MRPTGAPIPERTPVLLLRRRTRPRPREEPSATSVPVDHAADRHHFLVQRILDLLAVDGDGVVGVAAVVAVEMDEAGFAVAEPHHVAVGILDPGVDVVRYVVRPGHGDDVFGLGIDDALLRHGVHEHDGDEEEIGEAEQGVEQEIRKRIRGTARTLPAAAERGHRGATQPVVSLASVRRRICSMRVSAPLSSSRYCSPSDMLPTSPARVV